MTKKILITGGTGFVGHYLFRALRQSEPKSELHLTGLHSKEIDGAIVHALDLTDRAAVNQLIQDLHPDQIYHLASLASIPASLQTPYETIDNNIRLTLNLLEAVRQFSPSSRILLISSADIYLPQSTSEKISEDFPLSPANPYAASKAAQDFIANSYQKSFNLDIIRARPFNHIGPGQSLGFVVADFASAIAAAEKDPAITEIKVGNLSAARDFTDVADMVQAYIILMQKGVSGEIYNLGRGQTVTIQSILDQLLALATKEIKVVVDQSKFRPVDIPAICADNRKIIALGWQPQIPLADTLANILQYWRDKMV